MEGLVELIILACAGDGAMRRLLPNCRGQAPCLPLSFSSSVLWPVRHEWEIRRIAEQWWRGRER